MKRIKRTGCLLIALLLVLGTLFACGGTTDPTGDTTGGTTDSGTPTSGEVTTAKPAEDSKPSEDESDAPTTPTDPATPTMPTKLPTSTTSVLTTGADFTTIAMEFSEPYVVETNKDTNIDLESPVAFDVKAVGFLLVIETDGVFNLSFAPKTTTRVNGHGFDTSKAYSVFRYKPDGEWKEYSGEGWNVPNLVAGIYFIPLDAYAKCSEMTPDSNVNGFFTSGRGDGMTVTSVAMVVADVDKSSLSESATTEPSTTAPTTPSTPTTPTEPTTTTIDHLPTSSGSAFATGKVYTATKLEFKETFTVENQATVKVELKDSVTLSETAVGFLLKVEATANFNLCFMPHTTTRPNGHGFVGGEGYSIFEWDEENSTWIEHHSTLWNVADLSSGTYFIPMDAYGASNELTAENIVSAFTSVGIGGPATFTEVSLLTVPATTKS